MKANSIATILATLALSACGGGGGGGGNGASSNSATYTYVTLPAGQTSTYAYTVTNSDKSSASYNAKTTVTTVNADGSYVQTWVPVQTGYALDGTLFSLSAETDTFNNFGDEIQVTQADSPSTGCGYTYTYSATPTNLTAGQSYSDTYTSHCAGLNPGSPHTATTTFVGIESITVPAGTFNAYKLQYTQTDPASGSSGTSSTFNNTTWYDTSSTGSRIIRSTSQYSSSNTVGQTIDMQLTSTK